MVGSEQSVKVVRGIAFDLEGTAVDIEDLHHAAHLRAAREVGVKLSRDEAVRRLPHFVGGPDEEVAAEIASLADHVVSTRGVLLAKRSHFSQLLQRYRKIPPREGFLEFLSWVQELGLAIAIGTVTERVRAHFLLRQAGLLHEFGDELVVAREDVALMKPSPDVYYETARRMGISPSDQLVFEDSVIGVSAARSAGCRVAALPVIQMPHFLDALYDAGAEAVFNSWCDPQIRPFILKLVTA